MSFSRNRLLCYAALPDGVPFTQAIPAARERGFTELSVWTPTLREWARELGEMRAVRRFLDEQQMRLSIVEILARWHEAQTPEHRREVDELLEMADVLGAEMLTAGCLLQDLPDRELACRNLAEQCRLGAGQGLRIALEFIPWGGVPNLSAAREIIEKVSEENLGYLFDTWHFIRSDEDFASLEQLPGEALLYLQISDAPRTPEPDLLHETMHARLPPGQGANHWERLLPILREKCPDAPVAAELFSDEIKALPLSRALDALYLAVPGGMFS